MIIPEDSGLDTQIGGYFGNQEVEWAMVFFWS